MSHILKINLTLWASALALGTVVAGLVWGSATRASDLERLGGEMKDMQSLRSTDHDTLASIRGDLQTLKALMERIERKLP
jgi:hypothetical protein